MVKIYTEDRRFCVNTEFVRNNLTRGATAKVCGAVSFAVGALHAGFCALAALFSE